MTYTHGLENVILFVRFNGILLLISLTYSQGQKNNPQIHMPQTISVTTCVILNKSKVEFKGEQVAVGEEKRIVTRVQSCTAFSQLKKSMQLYLLPMQDQMITLSFLFPAIQLKVLLKMYSSKQCVYNCSFQILF